MLFTVLPTKSRPPANTQGSCFLVKDNWDDWGKYQTLFGLYVTDEAGGLHEIGAVKIGQMGLRPSDTIQQGARSPELEQTFHALDERCFSVGQDETYYEALNRLSRELRESVLKSLRDCAFDTTIFTRAENEEVMLESLLRFVSRENVLNRFHRLAKGDAKLTEFHFSYQFPPLENCESANLSFHVRPKSEPPTNVHVLIGRNGVGKTRCIQLMASSICRGNDNAGQFGSFDRLGDNKENWSFAGLILVSFSAFDSFLLPPPGVRGLKANMVGLRHRNDNDAENEPLVGTQAKDLRSLPVKTPNELANDFRNSFSECKSGLRAERWLKAVQTLESDPLFAEANIAQLLDVPESDWEGGARNLFSRLSSGHAIVLLAITRLVELVDEKTFVLLDEPEGHLHPPLLSTFIRALSDLLINRNAVALIATHSPVVLQEVPKSCVWILQRSGDSCVAERPIIETFGENVGVLTSSVFGLEVTSSGFHRLIKQAIEGGNDTYELLLRHFDNQLGAEAKALARSLLDSHHMERDEAQ